MKQVADIVSAPSSLAVAGIRSGDDGTTVATLQPTDNFADYFENHQNKAEKIRFFTFFHKIYAPKMKYALPFDPASIPEGFERLKKPRLCIRP